MAVATRQTALPAPASSLRPTHVNRALLSLASRLELRGALIVVASAAAYVVIEVQGYVRTYPDAASRRHLLSLDSPAVRMLQGVPYRVDTVGGYVVWDGGWVMAMVIGIWAILTTTRLLRGEEESGHSEFVLAGPLRSTTVTTVMLTAVFAAVVLSGMSAAVALWLSGPPLAGSLLFGLGLAGFAATMTGVAAVTSQVFGSRRRAAGTAALVFGASYVLRMIANSSEGRSWVGWATPFGWMDRLHAFGEDRWAALLPFAVASLVLAGIAVHLRTRRDDAVGLVVERDRRAPQTSLLGSSTGFAWRGAQGVWLAWVVGLAAYSFVLGTLVKTIVDFLAQDPQYQKTLEALGWDAATSAKGFISAMVQTLAVAFALYACWRIGAARTEEASKRIDLLLAAPLSRTRWLGEHVLLMAAASTALVVVSGAALWAGAWMTGAHVDLPGTVASALNTLPVVAVFGGLAVLVLAVLPRATVAVTASLVVVLYIVNLLGPTLGWPQWLIDLSPFAHLSFVPVQDWKVTQALVMTGLGVAFSVVGVWIFGRRDLAEA